jgi:hypothetical protein
LYSPKRYTIDWARHSSVLIFQIDRPPTASPLHLPPETSARPTGSFQKKLPIGVRPEEGISPSYFCSAFVRLWPFTTDQPGLQRPLVV